ncbi:hypothetical protein GOP47_0025860 [Adiantum capillus-veneris]|uniref:Uncharacterized protein n=1 Tax=Adiantum capillus-veneris TaxID=13818 RepID=A0A9D4U0V8_ADICA|nr:hypothetical protein GOP47_0025860 [Adiantum capillus-veneris]
MVVAINTLSSGSRCPDSVYAELHVFVCGHVDLGARAQIIVLRDAELYTEDRPRVALMVGCLP